ncbi:hypothetical protein [Serratia nevei]|uniref:MrpH family fimbial adhesin n=1 Tax=Serratia nevei TaxID=2703794 RepID=UPI00313EFD71
MVKVFSAFFGVIIFVSFPVAADWELDVKYEPRGHDITIKIKRWDEYDERPNPLYDCLRYDLQADCKMTIRYSGFGVGNSEMRGVSFKEMSTARTLGDLARVSREKGVVFTGRIPMAEGERYCFSLTSVWRGKWNPMPGGVNACSRAEIVPTYCSISEPYIELNHGAINANAINGHTISRSFNVSCNTNYKVLVIAQDLKSVLSLGGGLQSQLKVNDTDLGEGYVTSVGPGGKSLTLTSTLSGYTSGTGNFQGAKVIMLSLP